MLNIVPFMVSGYLLSGLALCRFSSVFIGVWIVSDEIKQHYQQISLWTPLMWDSAGWLASASIAKGSIILACSRKSVSSH